MMPISRLSPLALACLLTGCANTSTDPHTGGLIGGIKGLTTGAYDQRIAERTREVDDLEAANMALAGRVRTADARLKDVETKIATNKSRLATLKLELAEIDQLLSSGAASKAMSDGRLRATNEEIERKERILAPLRAERVRLEGMVKELEENHRIEAMNYEKMRAIAGSAPGTAPSEASRAPAMADLEKRLIDMDKKQSDALAEAARIKEAALQR